MKAFVGVAVGVSLAATIATGPAPAQAPTSTMSTEQAREETAYAIGLQAYLWGYPLHEYSRTTPKGIQVGAPI